MGRGFRRCCGGGFRRGCYGGGRGCGSCRWGCGWGGCGNDFLGGGCVGLRGDCLGGGCGLVGNLDVSRDWQGRFRNLRGGWRAFTRHDGDVGGLVVGEEGEAEDEH